MHMAEGGGTVGYLDNNGPKPARGVSVHFVIEYDGDIVQMLPISHACGGLNPDDRSTNKGYYGHDTLVAVLGVYWSDPNSASIQIEIEGYAKDGPNSKQHAAIVALVRQLRLLVPTLRGAFGHADQTDTKHCPGTTIPMKAVFTAVGGHGIWEDMTPIAITDSVPKMIDVAVGLSKYDLDGKTVLSTGGLALPDRYSLYGVSNGMRSIFATVDGLRRIVLVKPTAVRPIPPPVAVPDPAQLVAAYNDGVTAAATAAATAHK